MKTSLIIFSLKTDPLVMNLRKEIEKSMIVYTSMFTWDDMLKSPVWPGDCKALVLLSCWSCPLDCLLRVILYLQTKSIKAIKATSHYFPFSDKWHQPPSATLEIRLACSRKTQLGNRYHRTLHSTGLSFHNCWKNWLGQIYVLGNISHFYRFWVGNKQNWTLESKKF